MEKSKFELNEKEQEKYLAWKKTLPKVPEGYFGAAGGGYWFKFRPTGLGTIVEAGRDDVPKMNINLTDFEGW
jgi:hypothetical protein